MVRRAAITDDWHWGTTDRAAVLKPIGRLAVAQTVLAA